MLALREAKLSVPKDFAVVGYDDLPIASYTCPPLTSISTHPFEQGKLLAEAAIALMNNEKVGSHQNVLSLELVIRSSCGASTRGKAHLPAGQRSGTVTPSFEKPSDPSGMTPRSNFSLVL